MHFFHLGFLILCAAFSGFAQSKPIASFDFKVKPEIYTTQHGIVAWYPGKGAEQIVECLFTNGKRLSLSIPYKRQIFLESVVSDAEFMYVITKSQDIATIHKLSKTGDKLGSIDIPKELAELDDVQWMALETGGLLSVRTYSPKKSRGFYIQAWNSNLESTWNTQIMPESHKYDLEFAQIDGQYLRLVSFHRPNAFSNSIYFTLHNILLNGQEIQSHDISNAFSNQNAHAWHIAESKIWASTPTMNSKNTHVKSIQALAFDFNGQLQATHTLKTSDLFPTALHSKKQFPDFQLDSFSVYPIAFTTQKGYPQLLLQSYALKIDEIVVDANTLGTTGSSSGLLALHHIIAWDFKSTEIIPTSQSQFKVSNLPGLTSKSVFDILENNQVLAFNARDKKLLFPYFYKGYASVSEWAKTPALSAQSRTLFGKSYWQNNTQTIDIQHDFGKFNILGNIKTHYIQNAWYISVWNPGTLQIQIFKHA